MEDQDLPYTPDIFNPPIYPCTNPYPDMPAHLRAVWDCVTVATLEAVLTMTGASLTDYCEGRTYPKGISATDLRDLAEWLQRKESVIFVDGKLWLP